MTVLWNGPWWQRGVRVAVERQLEWWQKCDRTVAEGCEDGGKKTLKNNATARYRQ